NNDYQTSTDPLDDVANDIPKGISPGGAHTAGHYRAHIPSLNLTLQPWQRVYFSGTFAYQNARTTTATSGISSVVPYEGDIYSLIASATYMLDKQTDLVASYAFSQADFSQDNANFRLPYGIEYAQHGLQIGVRHRFATSK